MMMGVASSSAIFTYRVKYYSVLNALEIDAAKKLYLPYSDVFFFATIVCALGIIVAFLQGKTGTLEGER